MEKILLNDEIFGGSSDLLEELEHVNSGYCNKGIGNSDANKLLSELNDEQKDAVTHIDGPVLILAGAGSGKTRVITYRIAYMMRNCNIPPYSILAITFTNKAAKEMRDRINSLVGDASEQIWCGTFHSIFARILRRHAECIGYDSNFTILDSDDQLKLVKESMKELGVEESRFKPRSILAEISNAKNKLRSVEEYEKYAGNDYFLKNCAKVYRQYNAKLKANNAMDFDDILVNMVKLLSSNPDIRTKYQERFRYIMVDEYQDTNIPQYKAVMLLASGEKNICVVGDDDQSIYSFRGADVTLILKFEKDFPGAKVIKLEENYRSTKTILDAANCVISNNTRRKQKTLRTEGAAGDKVIVMNSDSGAGEAGFVANTIKMMVEKNKFSYSDCAVLYRMNALSRNIESAFHNAGIPFKVYGGMRFYDRKEIKDVFAYLRLINDTKDNIAFERIINVPKRGIGDTTVEHIRGIAIAENISMFDAACAAMQYPELIRAAGKLSEFTGRINSMRDELIMGEKNFAEFVEYVENESGIIDEIIAEREKKGEVVDRVENLKELLSEATEFDKAHRSEDVTEDGNTAAAEPREDDGESYMSTATSDTTEGILGIYLSDCALMSEGDNYDESDDFVRLMSIHSSKGLEFGAVFVTGLEEGIFPSYRSIQSEDEIEEERRLMYVAITRAKRNLFLVLSRQRMLFGQTQCNRPSRFLKEINPELLYLMGTKRENTAADSDSAALPQRDDSRRTIASALASTFDRKKNSGAAGNHTKDALGPDDIVANMSVVHPRFGEGRVLKVEKIGGDALVCVDFEGMTKNMLVNSAGLKKA